MTFAEIVQEILDREYHSGNTKIFEPWAATLQAANEILEGYYDLDDAKDELAWLRAPLNEGSKVRYTGMGYEFDAETLKLALALRACYDQCVNLPDNSPIRVKREAEFLCLQIPNPYDNGVWYPAVTAGGRPVEIRHTTGRGKNLGSRYLHARREVEIVLSHPNGAKEHTGRTTWVHFRVNLETGTVEEV